MKMRSSLTLFSLSLCLFAAPACGEEGDETTGATETTGADTTSTTGGTDTTGSEDSTTASDESTTGTDETTGGTDDTTTGGTGDGDGDTTDTTDTTDGGDGDSTTGGDGDNPNAGVVNCGNEVCDLDTEVCCQGISGASCGAPGSCGPLAAQVECDGPEDCDGQQRCCAGFPQGSSCADACADGEADVCHTDADCPTTDCLTCSVPGTEQLMCAETCP
jgi:hypothetical protein